MRIERRQHAANGPLNKIFRLRLIDIVLLNLIQDLGEGLEFLIGFAGVTGSLPAFPDDDSTEQSECDHWSDHPRLPPRLLFHNLHIPSFLRCQPLRTNRHQQRVLSFCQPVERIDRLGPFTQLEV